MALTMVHCAPVVTKLRCVLAGQRRRPHGSHGSTSASLLAHEHVSPKLDLIAGVTDPESFPLKTLAAGARLLMSQTQLFCQGQSNMKNFIEYAPDFADD